MAILLRSAVLILDHCDSRLALEHGAKLGAAWQCANKTEVAPGSEASCSNIFSSCHTLLDGYYLEILICFLLGMSWLSLWGWRTINYLTEAPEQEWRVVKSSKEK